MVAATMVGNNTAVIKPVAIKNPAPRSMSREPTRITTLSAINLPVAMQPINAA